MASNAHIFGAKCPNGHVSYHNKRKVCVDSVEVWRRDDHQLEILLLTCPECGKQFEVEEDCGGYR